MNAPDLIHRTPSASHLVSTPAGAGLQTAAGSPTVLFVDQTGQLGGAELALLPLAVAFGKRGEVVLLADGPFRTRLEAQGVRVRILNDAKVSNIRRQASGFSALKALPGMVRQMRALAREARRFDVLFLNTQKALVLGALSKPLHRRPVIWLLHDIMSPAHFGAIQLIIVKWLVRHIADQVIANSRASAEALSALTGIALEAIPVIPNGIDSDPFNALDASNAATRRALRVRLGLPEDVWLAGLFGRLTRWKGQHIAIEALTRLPGVHLVLVGAPLFGEDAYADGLRRQAEALGVAERVHFAGFRDDIPCWMKAMDVILHTSIDPEPLGRVVIEGLLAGRPVIAAAAGGVLEIVRHGENGLLVRPGDVTSLADAIQTLQRTPELAERLADHGTVDAQRDFSLDSYITRMTHQIAQAARK